MQRGRSGQADATATSGHRLGRRTAAQVRHYALSRRLDPAEALRVVRAHWSIENNQHWLLDVAFDEDRAHTCNDNTAENLVVLRRLALNLLRAGWSDAYLLSLLRQMP